MDPSTTGVAILEQTIELGAYVTVVPRRQPMILPIGIPRVAVVRIETDARFREQLRREPGARALLRAAVSDLLTVAATPHISALQIDFDVRRSERGFYRKLLQETRQRMPSSLPLTITALASWCSTDDWISDLPISQATPMFFRMEPDRRRALATAPEYRIREPLCQGSVGVSTTEPWPPQPAAKRLYIFADRGWAEDLARLQEPKSPTDKIHLENAR